MGHPSTFNSNRNVRATWAALCLRRRRSISFLGRKDETVQSGLCAKIQFHRQYRRVFRFAREEIQRAESADGRAKGTARIPPRPEGEASEIWRRHGVSARRRRRGGEAYGTIPSVRVEEIGGEVRSTGASQPLAVSLWLLAKTTLSESNRCALHRLSSEGAE